MKSLEQGFTVNELLIALSIATIVIGYTVPSLSQLLESVRLGSYANQFLNHYRFARSSAILLDHNLHFCSRSDLLCNEKEDWSNGWLIYIDKNNNQQADEGEILRVGNGLPNNYSLSPNVNSNQLIFYTNGEVKKLNGSLPLITFRLCSIKANDKNQEIYARELVINGGGRMRLQHGRNGVTRCDDN